MADPSAEVYEWTVLKRVGDERVYADVAIEHGSVLWRQVGIIGSESAYLLYADDTAAIGALAGAGEYLCVCDSRAQRLVLVAETVYRRAAEPSDEQLAEKMLGGRP